MTFLAVLAWVLGVATLAVAALLASWLRCQGQFDARALRLRLGWRTLSGAVDLRERCFELYLFEYRLLRREQGARAEPGRERRPKRRGRARRPRGAGEAEPAWRSAAAWRFYLRQLTFVRDRVHLDRCDGELRLASPDPALTGMAYGVACGLVQPIAARWPRVRVTITPDFLGTMPGGWVAFAVRIRIATLALVAWRVLWFERSTARRRRARRTEWEGRPHATE